MLERVDIVFPSEDEVMELTGLSLPGAAIMTLAGGALFGFWYALVLVSFASSIGATLAFLVSRILLRDWVQGRFARQLRAVNEGFEKDGAFYLFSLRLVPVFPFFVINLVMGLTLLPTRTFWWVSQLGMLPGTMLYVYAGSRVPSLGQLAEKGISSILSPSQLGQLAFAFALLGAFPLIIKHLLGRRRLPDRRPD